ncbi:MAG: SurA N-terminal domain-containing protein [Elusimicrobiota bacterium]
MMNYMRKHMKKVLWTVAFLFIIGIFFWYGTGGGRTYAAKVNGTRIEMKEFQSEFNRSIRQYRQENDEVIDEKLATELRQQTLSSLINQEILFQEAKRMDILATNEEIVRTIQSLPQFHHEDQFNIEVYKNILQYNLGMTPDEFEKMIKKSIAIQKLQQLIISSAVISEPELKLYYENSYSTPEEFKEKKDEFKEDIIQDKRFSLYSYWTEKLRENVNIDINPRVIQAPQKKDTQAEPSRPF